MKNSRRVVFDTGVLVSASLFENSIPRQALDVGRIQCSLLASISTFAELRDVLMRAKFDRYVSKARRLEFLATLAADIEVVEVSERVHECRDPDDDKFLELAVSGGAEFLVSGDADLLALHPFRGVRIVTPTEFLRESGADCGP